MTGKLYRDRSLSMPRWAWVVYMAVVAILGVATGSCHGFASVFFAAFMSFQFWTIAAFMSFQFWTIAAFRGQDAEQEGAA